MARIIPWTLPPVRGGSIGGYTPASGDSDPDVPTEYYDFANALIDTLYMPGSTVKENMIYLSTTGDTPVFTSRNGIANPYCVGIEAINLVGVSSVSVTIDADLRGNYPSVIVAAVNPISPNSALTLISAETEYPDSTPELELTVRKATFTVYNGNGEILQNVEVDYS